MHLDDVCWQERYDANEVYTLQCEITDTPDMLGKLAAAIGTFGAHIVNTTIVELTDATKTLDIVVFCNSREQVDKTAKAINAIDGMDVHDICDEVMEIHRRGRLVSIQRD